MSILNKENYFATTDIVLATTLQFFGNEINSIEKDSSGKSIFYFKRVDDQDTIIQNFWSQKLKVEPINFFNSLRVVKSRLYGNK